MTFCQGSIPNNEVKIYKISPVCILPVINGRYEKGLTPLHASMIRQEACLKQT